MAAASPDTMSMDDNTADSRETPLTSTTLEGAESEAREQSEQLSPEDTNASQEQASSRPHMPVQKRRRVTRACDECRRKKIKCDGKQPCTHCTVYSYECTYDQPSNRRRNAAPQYVEALENRMKRAEALLAAVLPGVNIDDPALVAGMEEGRVPSIFQGRPFPPPNVAMGQIPIERTDTMNPQSSSEEGQLESMVRATGQLDLDEHGNWDYYGVSSGLSFLHKMREHLSFLGDGGAPTFAPARPISHVFESPRSVQDSPAMVDNSLLPGGVELPPRRKALELCEIALNDAGALLRVVHLPTFYKNFEEMYNKSSEEYGTAELSFLPLLYMVLAQGMLFSRDRDDLDQRGYEDAINQGVQYFRAARSIIDVAMCRDLNALQALVFMILFLQSSSKLSTCYAFIGVALRSALRMGLHRSIDDRFNPIENEIRKRLFWVIRKMDIYVGAMLGLPYSLSSEEIDQELPAEIDDEYITETGYGTQPPDKVPVMAACNAHTTLIDILSKVVRVVYPIKGKTQTLHGQKIMSYTVSYADIRDIEKDLHEWMENLPMALKPGGEQPPLIIRVRQLLRMAYAHTQMMLYRPFIHYVSKSPNCNTQDKRAYACASACVSVSRNIIHIAVEMKKKGMLNGAYWFTMYTTFFAIMTLVFFAVENPESPMSQDVMKESIDGKDVLAALARRSMAADRCTTTLRAVFGQLPDQLQRIRENVIAAANRKRRQAPSPNPETKSMSGLSEPDLHDIQFAPPRRANTFPKNATPEDTKLGSFRPSFPQPVDLQSSRHSPFAGTPESPFHASMPSSSGFYGGVPSGIAPSPAQSSVGLLSNPTPQYGFSPVNNFFDRSNALNLPISDLSAMMFPSADPLAYPNQPMTMYENNAFSSTNQADMNAGRSGNHPLAGFHFGSSASSGTPVSGSRSNSTRNSGIFALPPNATPHDQHGGNVDIELYNPGPFVFAPGGAQIAGFRGVPGPQQQQPHQHQQQPPLPPQPQQQQHQHQHGGARPVGTAMFGIQGSQHEDMGMGMGGQMGGGGGGAGNMSFDELFTGEEWAGMFADHGSGMGQGMGFGFR